MHLTPCNMQKNITRLLQCKINGDHFRYIIIRDTEHLRDDLNYIKICR